MVFTDLENKLFSRRSYLLQIRPIIRNTTTRITQKYSFYNSVEDTGSYRFFKVDLKKILNLQLIKIMIFHTQQ